MNREIKIENTIISDASDCYVIAEVGHNHQGSIEKARLLFKTAKDAWVNAVKLQKRDNRSLFTKSMYAKPYENENSFGATYGEHREALEFGKSEYEELKAYAKELGLTLFATAFDFKSADFLAELDMPAYKLASGDLQNIPLLKYVANFKKPLILSTGGGSLEDIKRAYDAIMPINPQICLLQCTANYPTPPEEINLRVITTLREAFSQNVVGLSDHYNGIAMAVAAFTLGARVIEKHFTLNHTWKGTDHALSLEPIGMQKMVRDLRRAKNALGDGIKRPYPSEVSALKKMGKKLVARRNLPAGHRLTEMDIAQKSPGDGLPPYELERLVGKTLRQALKEDDALTWENLS
jgi:N-acetylneuraminate synthase/sialic acid synthase